jgi:lipid-A-disaccharide synthase
MTSAPHIYLIAGEASGDVLGAALMAAIAAQTRGAVTFSGVGGAQMAKQGLQSLFDHTELSVMGIAEVLPKIPHLLVRIRETASDIAAKRPDVVITIDSPDFSFRVAKIVQRECPDIKRIHYVAPSVWAWREGRAEKVARLYDGLICFFDFERPYFERHGLKTVAVGHPVVESGVREADGGAFKRAHGITRPTMGVFFGSRRGELSRMGATLAEIMAHYAPTHDIIVPTLPHLKAEIEARVAGVPGRVIVTCDPAEKWAAFKACDRAVAVSGTVGLELAVAGVPHVIAYRMNALTYKILRRIVKVQRAHLINILAGREVIPEYIQDESTPEWIIDGLERLSRLPLSPEITAQLGRAPSEDAARFVLSLTPVS